jgi:hypothetical protein
VDIKCYDDILYPTLRWVAPIEHGVLAITAPRAPTLVARLILCIGVELGSVIENKGKSIFFLCTNITHTSVASGIGPNITTFSTDFFSFQNLIFWNLFEFSRVENHFKINISHILNPKSCQIHSIKSCSSRSFQQHQRHIPIPPRFLALI